MMQRKILWKTIVVLIQVTVIAIAVAERAALTNDW